MTSEINANRHYAALMGGAVRGNSLRIKVACGSTADVMVSQVRGMFLQEAEDGEIGVDAGPLVIDCDQHGKYLGLLGILPRAPKDEKGSAAVSLPLMLIPLPNVEHVLPLGMR